jgi:hypothetical protein
VRLVNHDARQLALPVYCAQVPPEALKRAVLRRYVEQASARMAALEVAQDRLPLRWRRGAVERRRLDAGLAQRRDLVLLFSRVNFRARPSISDKRLSMYDSSSLIRRCWVVRMCLPSRPAEATPQL